MTLGSDSTADRARLGFSNKGGLVERHGDNVGASNAHVSAGLLRDRI
jgi:hypothetical protein